MSDREFYIDQAMNCAAQATRFEIEGNEQKAEWFKLEVERFAELARDTR